MAGKVGCALLLAVLFAAAAVSRTSFAVFLASLAVLLVGFLAWYVRTLRRDVTVTLQLPARPVHPDEDFAVLVKLHNNGRRPVPELRVVLQAVDAESGTAIELPCGAMLAPHQCADLRVTLRAAKSGLWRFRVREATVRDLLGLFAAHCAVPPQSRELCVLPPAEGEDDGAGTKPQNCAEKVTAAGCDLTDGVYDLRPYRAGDSPKLIHWKLTARVGELTVREPLGATYRADPAGSVLAEGADAPQQLLHFGQAAVKRLRRLTRRKDTDPATGLVFVDRVLLPRTKAAAHPMAETAADLLISELLALGLLTALNGAFALALPIWVWLGVCGVAGTAPRPAFQGGPLRRGAGAGRGVSGAAVCRAAAVFGRCGTVRGCRQAVPEYTLQRKFCGVHLAGFGADGPVCAADGSAVYNVFGRADSPPHRRAVAGGGASADRGVHAVGGDGPCRFGLAAAFAGLVGKLCGGAVTGAQTAVARQGFRCLCRQPADPPHKPKAGRCRHGCRLRGAVFACPGTAPRADAALERAAACDRQSLRGRAERGDRVAAENQRRGTEFPCQRCCGRRGGRQPDTGRRPGADGAGGYNGHDQRQAGGDRLPARVYRRGL